VTTEPFALSVKAAARYSGLGLTTLKKLIRDGVLASYKAGRRTLLLRADIERYLLSLDTDREPIPRDKSTGKFAPRRKRG
jgi:excisionase family DNA binding protein